MLIFQPIVMSQTKTACDLATRFFPRLVVGYIPRLGSGYMFSRSWLPITFSRAWSSVLCKFFLHLSVEASKILATTNRLHSVVFQRIEVFLFSHIVNANYPSLVGQHRRISNLGRDLRPHCVQSVLTTSGLVNNNRVATFVTWNVETFKCIFWNRLRPNHEFSTYHKHLFF